MGDAADLILEGVVCEICGEYMNDGDGCGYPVTCDGCGGNADFSFDEFDK